MSTQIIDDKSPHCIPFILSHLKTHLQSQSQTSLNSSPSPFIIALNGIQGSGKTTLVSTLSKILSSPPHSLPTLVLSIDDFYLPHQAQLTLARSHPSNKLIQHRGEPGTHDIALLNSVFEALREGREVRVPVYDKSAFKGAGDRIAEERWRVVNREGEEKVRVVIFEGWCVGFSALSTEALKARVEQASKTLRSHSVEDLMFINSNLAGYEKVNKLFDAFVHIDAQDTEWVYGWREEQEEALRREGRGGMSKEQVVSFVDGYFPAYELYVEALREGVFKGREGREGRQLRMIVGGDRRVKEVVRI